MSNTKFFMKIPPLEAQIQPDNILLRK